MDRNITHYAIPVKKIFTPGGMDSGCAERNNHGMEREGLKRARKRLGVGQAVIASRMKVSIPQISRWETGKDGIPSQRLSSLLAAYEGSLEELLGEEPVEDGPVETEPSPAELPSADDFAKILGAVAPLASASLGNEAVLQVLGGHFRAMVERRLQHPEYPIERILGSLDERLRALDDPAPPPA